MAAANDDDIIIHAPGCSENAAKMPRVSGNAEALFRGS
jgi:hypothetical protein